MSDNGSDTDYGFWWGPMVVSRLAHIEGKGRVIRVASDYHSLQVWVSEKGRSIRCWLDGVLLEVPE